jgi:hypothetical protein
LYNRAFEQLRVRNEVLANEIAAKLKDYYRAYDAQGLFKLPTTIILAHLAQRKFRDYASLQRWLVEPLLVSVATTALETKRTLEKVNIINLLRNISVLYRKALSLGASSPIPAADLDQLYVKNLEKLKLYETADAVANIDSFIKSYVTHLDLQGIFAYTMDELNSYLVSNEIKDAASLQAFLSMPLSVVRVAVGGAKRRSKKTKKHTRKH